MEVIKENTLEGKQWSTWSNVDARSRRLWNERKLVINIYLRNKGRQKDMDCTV